MRFRELLLEYDRSKTIANYGQRLWQMMSKDWQTYSGVVNLATATANDRLFGDREISDEEFNGAQMDYDTIVYEEVVKSVEAYDPTPHKEYVQWMIIRLLNGGIQRWEDMSKAHDFLARFHALKKTGFFKRHPEHAAMADINRIKTLSDLGEFILSIPDEQSVSQNEKERALERGMIERGDVSILVNDERFKIVIPRTQEASIFYGRNTQWCTASTSSHNYFDDYNSEGPLYIVLDKARNKRWQLHFPTGQFMDENDRNIVWSDFPVEVFNYGAFDLSDLKPYGRIMILADTKLPTELRVKMMEMCHEYELCWAWGRAHTQATRLYDPDKEASLAMAEQIERHLHENHSKQQKNPLGEHYVYETVTEFLKGLILHAPDLLLQAKIIMMGDFFYTAPTSFNRYHNVDYDRERDFGKGVVIVPSGDASYIDPLFAFTSGGGRVSIFGGNGMKEDQFTVKTVHNLRGKGPPSTKVMMDIVIDTLGAPQ